MKVSFHAAYIDPITGEGHRWRRLQNNPMH